MQHFQAAFLHLAQPMLPGKLMDAPDLAKTGLVYSLKVNAHIKCLATTLIAFFFGVSCAIYVSFVTAATNGSHAQTAGLSAVGTALPAVLTTP
ncbi:hypothetical protein [Rhizobium gallicum]|uniref:hypothetical protein n=1 Tax=Rhizobium gallicum TaxID=56730 RepID=UPI0012EB78A7